jgi:hypothetical protein
MRVHGACATRRVRMRRVCVCRMRLRRLCVSGVRVSDGVRLQQRPPVCSGRALQPAQKWHARIAMAVQSADGPNDRRVTGRLSAPEPPRVACATKRACACQLHAKRRSAPVVHFRSALVRLQRLAQTGLACGSALAALCAFPHQQLQRIQHVLCNVTGKMQREAPLPAPFAFPPASADAQRVRGMAPESLRLEPLPFV